MREMRILLVNPPWYRFFGESFAAYPIGLGYIAGVLEKSGFNVYVYNADYNREKMGEKILGSIAENETFDRYPKVLKDDCHPLWKEIDAVIKRISPDIVGISAMTGQYGSALKIARITKERDVDTMVVFGGVHPSVLPGEVIKRKEVDIVVRGEGEFTFLEIAEKIARENKERMRDVLGVTYKREDEIIHNPDRPLIKNLDALPFPARHLLLEKETYPSSAFGKMIVSRGCPHKCMFCISHEAWKKVRYRSSEKVVEEMNAVQNTYKTNFFYFDDAEFTMSKGYVMKICDLIKKEGLLIKWGCEGRLDEIDEELAKNMKEAGCIMICSGVESGDEGTLRKIEKDVTLEKIRKGRENLRKYGIGLWAFFIIGFPWETKKEIANTMLFMKELDPEVASFTTATPYPGTKLHDMCKYEGIIEGGNEWEYFLRQRPSLDINVNLKEEEASLMFKYTEKEFSRQNRRNRHLLRIYSSLFS